MTRGREAAVTVHQLGTFMTGTRDVLESERRRFRVTNADIEAVGETLLAAREGRLDAGRQQVAEHMAIAAAESFDRSRSKAEAARVALDSMRCTSAELKAYMGLK